MAATPSRVAAHLAMASLADYGTDEGAIGDFAYRKIDYRMQEHGRLHLATGRIALEVTTTGKRHDFAVAALHLGGIDFYAALKPYPGDDEFHHMVESPPRLRMISAEAA